VQKAYNRLHQVTSAHSMSIAGVNDKMGDEAVLEVFDTATSNLDLWHGGQPPQARCTMDIRKIVTQQAEHPEWKSLSEDKEFGHWVEWFRPDPKNIPSHTPLLEGDGPWEWAFRLGAQAEAWKRDLLRRASEYDEARACYEREVAEAKTEAKDTWERELEWKYQDGLREYEDGERSEYPVPPNFNDTAAFSAWKREQDKWHSQERAQWVRVKRLLNAEACEVGLIVKKAGRRTLWRLFCVLLSIPCIPLGMAGAVAYLSPESPLGVFCMDWILTPALFTVLAIGYIFYSLVTSGPVMWIAAAFGVVFLGMLGNYWAMALFERRRPRI